MSNFDSTYFSLWTIHFYVLVYLHNFSFPLPFKYATIFRELLTFLAFLSALFSFSRSPFEALVSSVLLPFGDDGKQYTSCSLPFFESDWTLSWAALSGFIVARLGRQCIVRRWNWRTGSSFFIIPELINGAPFWDQTREKHFQHEWTSCLRASVKNGTLNFPDTVLEEGPFRSGFAKGNFCFLFIIMSSKY